MVIKVPVRHTVQQGVHLTVQMCVVLLFPSRSTPMPPTQLELIYGVIGGLQSKLNKLLHYQCVYDFYSEPSLQIMLLITIEGMPNCYFVF